MSAQKKWTNQKIFDSVDEWIKSYGEFPRADQWKYSADDHPTYMTIWHRFGSWENFIKKYRRRRREWDKEKVILVFQEWGERFGRPPSVKECRQVRGYVLPSPSTVISLFGSWNNAIEAAGFVALPQGLTRISLNKYLPLPRKEQADGNSIRETQDVS